MCVCVMSELLVKGSSGSADTIVVVRQNILSAMLTRVS